MKGVDMRHSALSDNVMRFDHSSVSMGHDNEMSETKLPEVSASL